MERHRGVTLPELVFTVAIGLGLLGWGIPAFRDLRLDASRAREVNQFVQAVYLARSDRSSASRSAISEAASGSSGSIERTPLNPSTASSAAGAA